MSGTVYRDGILRQWWDDPTRTYREYDASGSETLARPYDSGENADADATAARTTAETNDADLRAKARSAIQKNADYLDIASPTNAQNLAQIRLLTRETTALIRLMIRELSDTSGT